ncbi:MAG: aldo/keto reductase [Calditrichaeota bacterium]|nr:MAG: aldo/keto reductase [Calditrichota bacterium]
MNLKSTFTLNNGIKIPVIGLGVFKNPSGASTQQAILSALKNGYRHIDTAKIYANEQDVGAAIKQSGIPRDEIFITTKLWNADQGYDSTLRALDESLNKLRMDYVDLYLMHWPVENLRLDSWRAMEKLLNDGKTLAIGISNFMKRHVEQLLDKVKILPTVNQIELSPFNYLFRQDTIDFCLQNDIKIEAYSPLTKGRKLDDPKLIKIAQKYNKSTAQILIRWVLEHDFIVIPKSVNEHRIIENADVFDFSISKNDMGLLDGLNENLITGWDPTNAA